MTERELITNAMSRVKCPDEVLHRVFRAVKAPNRGKKYIRKTAVIALAACLAVVSGVTAMAISGVFRAEDDISSSAFLESVYGNNDTERSAYDQTIEDPDGNAVLTEHYPEIEYFAYDAELADGLLGEYIGKVDRGISCGGYTLTVHSMVLDENGIGAAVYELYSPDGLSLDAYGNVTENGVVLNPIRFELNSANGDFFDTHTVLIPASVTDTSASFVSFFTPFSRYDGGSITLNFYCNENGQRSRPTEEYRPDASVPVKSFVSEDARLALSPLGLVLDCAENSSVSDILIRFSDGEEYTVIGQDINNCSVSSLFSDGSSSAYSFNRPVDIGEVAEIIIHGTEPDGETEFSYTFLPDK